MQYALADHTLFIGLRPQNLSDLNHPAGNAGESPLMV